MAAGKAAQPMADAFLERYRERTRAVLIARGGHPVPDDASFAAGAQALHLADENRAHRALLVVLLSGGASAMLAAPAEGVTREHKIAVTRELLASGRPIAEINAVRKQLSAIKGGKLAQRAARSITFALSDVPAPIEDDPAVIGSGPTVGSDPAVRIRPPGSDPGRPVTHSFVLIGSRRNAMSGAREAAERLGYDVRIIDPPVLGEAREAAAAFVSHARALTCDSTRRTCVIAAGETTVTLR